jgi:hypothetical protein
VIPDVIVNCRLFIRTSILLFPLLLLASGCRNAAPAPARNCAVYQYRHHVGDPFSGGESVDELRHCGEVAVPGGLLASLSQGEPLSVITSADWLWVVLLNPSECLVLCSDSVSLRKGKYRMEGGGVVVDGDLMYFRDARVAGEMFDVLVRSGIVKEK